MHIATPQAHTRYQRVVGKTYVLTSIGTNVIVYVIIMHVSDEARTFI